ncbi:MAG: hypothetical protein SFZ03_07190 [Candidatus Melainabacteria bacterium]|nr:hypothetical protein [Candidatus Melainabacteria bacterium]
MSRRWYDENRYRPVKTSLGYLIQLPDEYNSIISEGVCSVAEEEFYAHEVMESVRSLGREKILALHKSKQRARQEDQNRHLHKAVTYLAVLSEDNKERLGHRMLELSVSTLEYFRACTEFQRDPSKKEVSTVVNVCVAYGNKESRQFVHKLRQRFLDEVEQLAAEQKPEHEFLKAHLSDMQIRISNDLLR